MATDVKKFLDQSGVSTLWSQVAKEVAKVNTKVEANTSDITTMKGQIAALEAGTYDDTAVRGLITANTNAIAILNGDKSTAGSAAKIAADEAALQVAAIVAGADESYDTLKEIADWIQSDSTGAAGMANDIVALKTKVGDETVATQISNAIDAALKVDGVDKYALASSLTTLTTRVKALEDAGYQTAAQVTTAINAAIAALNLSTTYETKGAAATALSDAKAYTDAEVAKIQALSEAEIQAAINSATSST